MRATHPITGRLWGLVGGCVLLLLALISLPLVQSAGLEVLTKEQKSGEGGERERELTFGRVHACSPLGTCPECRAPPFYFPSGVQGKSCSFCLRYCLSWQGKLGWPDGGMRGRQGERGRQGWEGGRRELDTYANTE